MQRTGSIAATAATFTLLGPVVAAAGVFLLVLLAPRAVGASTPVDPGQAATLFMLCVLFSYWLGGVAALLTGLAAAFVSARLKGLWAWVGASGVIGLVCTTLSVVVMGLDHGGSQLNQDFIGLLAIFCGAAVLASVASAFASNGFRPRKAPPSAPTAEAAGEGA